MVRTTRPSWEDYRRRRRLFWIAFLGTIPVATVGMILRRIVDSEYPFNVVALGWIGFFAYAGSRMNRFPCPRCGRPFFDKFLTQNPLAQYCVHCAWPKWRVRKFGDPEPLSARP